MLIEDDNVKCPFCGHIWSGKELPIPSHLNCPECHKMLRSRIQVGTYMVKIVEDAKLN